MVVVQPAVQELQLEGQAALSVQDQLGRRSQLSRLSPNSKGYFTMLLTLAQFSFDAQ